MSELEIAELTNIFENKYRNVQVGFAEEVYMYYKVYGVCSTELRNALNTMRNLDTLEPTEGVGEHCIPKDPDASSIIEIGQK
jgi:UDP-N-acetyl-D-mannosaminuronic acid dehydrogenase